MYTRCVVHDVIYFVDPAFKAHPAPPQDVDVDLPQWCVDILAADPDDDTALGTVGECLRFNVGFLGFGYCTVTAFGGITTKEA